MLLMREHIESDPHCPECEQGYPRQCKRGDGLVHCEPGHVFGPDDDGFVYQCDGECRSVERQ